MNVNVTSERARAELAGHIHAPLLAEHVPAPGMPGKSGDEQYSNTLEKLEDLRRVEAEARRRALPSEQPVQVARRQLQGVAERLHDVWPPSASTELSNERRSNALVEHAKRSTSIRATVNNLRSATVDEEHWLKAWQLRCETQLTLAQAAAAAAAESVTKGPHGLGSISPPCVRPSTVPGRCVRRATSRAHISRRSSTRRSATRGFCSRRR